MVGEPVHNEEFNQNGDEQQVYNVDDIFNGGNDPENPLSDEEKSADEDDEDDDEMNEERAEPLYHNAQITVKESMLLLLSLMLRLGMYDCSRLFLTRCFWTD